MTGHTPPEPSGGLSWLCIGHRAAADMRCRLGVLAMCVLLATTAPARAQPQVNPGASGTEQWVWEQVRDGKAADLHERCGSTSDPNVKGDRRRDACQTVSAAFVERILTREPWRSALPRRGLAIAGVRVVEPLDLSAARVAVEVRLEKGRFEGPVGLSRARFEGLLSFTDSIFHGEFRADGLHVGGDLYLNGSTVQDGPLWLTGAAVDRNLFVMGAHFQNGIEGGDLRVGGVLFLNRATIGGGRSVVLTGSSIGGDLIMGAAVVAGEVRADGLRVGGDVYLSGAAFARPPTVARARIEGGLDLAAATLPGLDLSGTTIGADLRLASGGRLPLWSADAKLVLRNARARSLDDRVDSRGNDAWPRVLDLQGFTYERLADGNRGVEWYTDWLARDAGVSRQPYRQLGAVFKAAGSPDREEAVLYAERDRELRLAWRHSDYAATVGLLLAKVFTGYAIGNGLLFLPLAWVLGLTALGAVVLRFSPEALSKGFVWRCGASLHHLLPIVELNKEFTNFLDDPRRERTEGWQLAYFAAHKLMGYLLAIFVGAAIAGLLKAE